MTVEDALARGGSYQLHAPEAQSVVAQVAIAAADLPPLDAADGKMDGRIFLPSIVGGRSVSLGEDSTDTDSTDTDSTDTDSTGVDPPSTPSRDSCYVSLQLGPGESCTYPGTYDDFTVNVRGRGRFLTYLHRIRIDVDNETIDGQVYDFRASHQGDGVWLIERVAGNTEPPSGDQ